MSGFKEIDLNDESVNEITTQDRAILENNGFTLNTSHILGTGTLGGVIYGGVINGDGQRWPIGQSVAIKYMYVSDNSLASGRIEVKVISRLRHPNIVHVFDCFLISKRRMYVVMELCVCGDLCAFLMDCYNGERTLSLATGLGFVRQLTDGLLYLQDNRIVHDDIHEENILLFNGDNGSTIVLKYCDFGRSYVLDDSDSDFSEDLIRISAVYVKILEHIDVDETIPYDLEIDIPSMATDLAMRKYTNIRDAIREHIILYPNILQEYSTSSSDSKDNSLGYMFPKFGPLKRYKTYPFLKSDNQSNAVIRRCYSANDIFRSHSSLPVCSQFDSNTTTDLTHIMDDTTNEHQKSHPIHRCRSLTENSVSNYKTITRAKSCPSMLYRKIEYPNENWLANMNDYPFNSTIESRPTDYDNGIHFEGYHKGYKLYTNKDDKYADFITDSDLTILKMNGFDMKVKRKLGSGTYGFVYEGYGNRNARRYVRRADGRQTEESFVGQRLAIKFMYLDSIKIKLGKRELRVVSQLRHPNIIDVYDCFLISERRLYIAMEFATDGHLESFLEDCDNKRETLTVDLFLSFIQQLTDGLLYLHDQNVVHNDIHVQNVLVFKNYAKQDESMIGKNERRIVLKYADFGNTMFGGPDVDFDLECLGELFYGICIRIDINAIEDIDIYIRDYSDFDYRKYANLREVIREYRFIHPEEHDRLVSGKFYAPKHWLRDRGKHPDWFFNTQSYSMPYRELASKSVPLISVDRPLARWRSEPLLRASATYKQQNIIPKPNRKRNSYSSLSSSRSSTPSSSSTSSEQNVSLSNYNQMEDWLTNLNDYPFNSTPESNLSAFVRQLKLKDNTPDSTIRHKVGQFWVSYDGPETEL